MKKLKILLFILFTIPIYSQWVQQNSGTTEVLNDIYCVTENFVVAVGTNGTILKTTDGGVTWVQKTSGTTSSLLKVQFANALVGYSIGKVDSTGAGLLFKTIDGGENWTNIAVSSITSILDMHCVNENLIYVNGNGTDIFKLLKSANGGNSFDVVNSGDTTWGKIQFITQDVGYVLTNKLLKTADAGVNWTIIDNNRGLL